MRTCEAHRGRRRARAPPVLARPRKGRWWASEGKQRPGAGDLDPASPGAAGLRAQRPRPPIPTRRRSPPQPAPAGRPRPASPVGARSRLHAHLEIPNPLAAGGPRGGGGRTVGEEGPENRPRGHPQAGAAPQHPASAEQWPEGLREPRRARGSRGARALEAPPLGRRPDNAGRATPPAPRPSAPRTRRGPGQSAAAAPLHRSCEICRAGPGAAAGRPPSRLLPPL